MKTTGLRDRLASGYYDETLLDVYGDESKVAQQRERYEKAVTCFAERFGEAEVTVFSAPGRSEIGGNHTDHQHGEVLAASISLDSIGVVCKAEDGEIVIASDNYADIEVNTAKLTLVEEEKGTTTALVKGVLAGLKERGYTIGGFYAYVTSDVLIGAGLSSSAAYETLIGTIISGLYNDMEIDPVKIAIIGQYAENVYFGKPCGLMDQMACSVGNLVHIDFKDPQQPVVVKVEFDMNKYGYSLCITDTKGSHADLTDDYAAVPKEMQDVAACFGKEYLIDITCKELMEHMDLVRSRCGDRAVLRALHFLNENVRVQKEVRALGAEDVDTFFALVKESGDSSYKYLQNVYSNHDVKHQNVSLALALSEMYLDGKGVSRVHGGGFAGTIQAFVKNEEVEGYQRYMDSVFGKGACSALKIRKYGGMKVIE